MLFFNFSVLLFGITNVNCKSWHDTYFFCFSSSSVLGSLFAIHVAYSSNIVLPNLIWLMHVVYKPLNPFFFIYLAGYFAAHIAQGIDKTVPSWVYANPVPALASLGRHALPFYLLHQPIILGILELVYSVR